MLRRQDVTFGVGHEAEDAAAGVANARDVALRAIRVDRIRSRPALRVDILEHYLSGLFQALEDPRLADDEVAFAVGDRHFELIVVLEKGALPRRRLEADPAILEFAHG